MSANTWKKAAKQNRKAYRRWFGMAMYYLSKWRSTEFTLHTAASRLAEIDCACESGNQYEPEFVCGWHQTVYEIEESRGYGDYK
jgi:hypothetical protein